VTRESVSEWTLRQPFIPFVLKLSNGTEYSVRHPEMAIPTLDTVLLGVIEEEGSQQRLWDRFKMVSMLHIVEIQPLKDEAKTIPKPSKN
jgi:hypothetical protein